MAPGALPPDWGVRGAYIPFAHPRLVGARLRWRAGGTADVVLPPEPGNFVGQYVVEIRRLGENVRLEPYDRRLVELIAEMRPVDPISIDRTALRARRDVEDGVADAAETRYLSIVARAIDRVAQALPGADRVFRAEIASAEADRVFAPTGLTAIDAVQRLEECARAAASVDRGRAPELADFAARLRVIADNSTWMDAGRVRQVEILAARAAAAAANEAARLDRVETDPVGAMAGNGPAGAARAALRFAWWLDGWAYPVARYAAVADDAAPDLIEAVLRDVMRMTPAIPSNTDFMPDKPGAAVAVGSSQPAVARVTRAPTVRANVDWLTGQPAQHVLEDRARWRQMRG